MGPTIENEEGDVSKGFAESANLIEGEVQAGGQLHFYMETQSVLVFPKDGNEFEVYASTQNPAGTQVCYNYCRSTIASVALKFV